jgi:hypothetical protein
MLKLDNSLLDELGLGSLSEDQKKSMLQHIYETLELRVGTNLANQMSDQQLDEFEKFIDDGGDANQAQALQWLESNLPNYKDVVNQVFEALKVEIKQMAPQILASSMQQAGGAPMAQAPMPAASPVQPVAPAPTVAQPYQSDAFAPVPPQSAPAAMPQYGPQPAPVAAQGGFGGYAAPAAPAPMSSQPASPAPFDPAASGMGGYQPQQPAPQYGQSVPQYGPQPMQPPVQGPAPSQPSPQYPQQQPPAGPGASYQPGQQQYPY